MSGESRKERVRVWAFPSGLEAQLAVSALAEEGIDAYFEGEHSHLTNVNLWVDPENRERALEILRAHSTTVNDKLRRDEDIVCMECESEDIELLEGPGKSPVRRLLASLFGQPSRARIRCRSCGYEYTARLY